MNSLYTQERLINEYGMTDPRYKNSYNELNGTFCVRTFRNVIPMVMGLLEQMKKEFYVEKGVCLSNGKLLMNKAQLIFSDCFLKL